MSKAKPAYTDESSSSSPTEPKRGFFGRYLDSEIGGGDGQVISGVEKYDPEIDYTESEENRVLSKIDYRLMSWVCLMFFFLQLDRSNIANAKTDNFIEDLNISQADFNTGAILFAAGFVIFEIPSNMVLKRIGSTIYIPLMMVAWGTVSWCQVFIHDRTSFFITRFMLGFAEAGYIPGIIAFLTQWYKGYELATRLSYFWGILAFASSFSGLLAYALLQLRGVYGLTGWQWLFLVEGIATVVFGIISFFYLPEGPTKTKGWLRGKHGWFSDREEVIAVTRVVRDDPSKAEPSRTPVKLRELVGAFIDSRLWMHLAIGFFGLMVPQPIALYLPSIIGSLGFSNIISNLLTAPPYFLSMVNMILLCRSSDKQEERGWHGFFGAAWLFVGLIIIQVIPDSAGPWVLYAALCFAVAFPYFHPINASWLAQNVAPAGKRTIGLAMYIISVNINNVVSQQIYREDDAPRYRRGNWILVGIAGFTMFLWIFAKWRYQRLNRFREEKWEAMTEAERAEYLRTTKHTGNDRLDFRFKN